MAPALARPRRPALSLDGRGWHAVAPALALVALGLPSFSNTPGARTGAETPADASDEAARSGVVVSEPQASPGYTLFAPLTERTTYLIDHRGDVVHRWEHDTRPGLSVYLLEDGSLLRCGQVVDAQFRASGHGGLIQRVSWEGELLWEYRLADERVQAHHDIEPLPNGNVIAIVWDFHGSQEAIASGRDPQTLGSGPGFLSGALLEIRPTGPCSGDIVWEWHAWDHRTQDRDPDAPCYAQPNDPGVAGRIDLNRGRDLGLERATRSAARGREPGPEDRTRIEAERALIAEIEADMRALGYAGGAEEPAPDNTLPERVQRSGRSGSRPVRGGPPRSLDWLHLNAVAYSPEQDLLLLCSRTLSEVWIVDHSTTTKEASGSSGGRFGHGGDLLYRWGNPAAYGCGTEDDRNLFLPHDPRWIDGGTAFTVFNNGPGRPAGDFSSVDEIGLPTDSDGELAFDGPLPHGPRAARWSYVAPEPESFLGTFLSGAERLAGGGTLICEGPAGRVFEIGADGDLVWEYLYPVPGGPAGGLAVEWKRPDVLPPRRSTPRTLRQRTRRAAMFRASRIPHDHPGLRGRL